jgi:uncharacterized protein (UPF0548 family)
MNSCQELTGNWSPDVPGGRCRSWPHDGFMGLWAGVPLSKRVVTGDAAGVTLTGSWGSRWPDGGSNGSSNSGSGADRRTGSVGYRAYERSEFVANGSAVWDFASAEVLRWGVKTRSGFCVEARSPSAIGVDRPMVVAGDRYWLVARLGPLRVREPVLVVAVVDKPDRKGFAYGTLAGHPVSGEEAFVVDRREDGSVWLTIRSLTRPASGPWRAAYPAALLAQRWYRRRYFRALRPQGS